MLKKLKKSKESRIRVIRKGLRGFYNEMADAFDQTRGWWWKDLEFLKSYVKKGDKILDFGCGNGRLYQFLKDFEQTFKYIGVDISKELIEICQKRYSKNNFKLIKKENKLEFEENHFDRIFSVAVFHHFNPEMAEKSLKELRRVLKEDGILVVTIWHLWNRKYLKYLIKSFLSGNFGFSGMVPFEKGKRLDFRHCYWWTKLSFCRVAKNSGFEILKSGYTYGKLKNKGRMRRRNMFFVLRRPKIIE